MLFYRPSIYIYSAIWALRIGSMPVFSLFPYFSNTYFQWFRPPIKYK